MKLFPHQDEGADFIAKLPRVIDRSEAGTGKTAKILTALDRSKYTKAVVVCPPTVMENWRQQAAQWLPRWKVRFQTGTKPVEAPTDGEILVTAYTRASIVSGGCGVLILDECHEVKNYKTAKHKRCKELAKRAGAIWALSATPITNTPMDLWCILTLMGMAKTLYRSFTQFCGQWGARRNWQGVLEWGKPKPTAWDALDGYTLKVQQSDLKDLPVRTSQEIYIDLKKSEAKEFTALIESFPGDPGHWDCASHGVFRRLARYSAVKASGVPKALAQMGIEPSTDDPVVLFTAHRAAARWLADHYGWPLITGEVPAAERAKIVEDFQNGAYPGLVGTIQTCGVGITLTRSRTLVFVSETFSHAINSQAADRVYRISQERPVRMFHVRTSHHLEKMIRRVIYRKKHYV